MVNQVPATATGSLKVTAMFVLDATLLAPLAGVVETTVGAASMVKAKVWLAAMVSGGSSVSTSVIPVATTVTVQATPAGSDAAGVRVKVVAGEALRVKGSAGAPVGQANWK